MAAPLWQDLHDNSTFEACLKRLHEASVHSFVVEVDASHVRCILDPTPQDHHAVFTGPVTNDDEGPRQTRWFNFWAGERDVDAIKAIAKRYGVSSRLTSLLCSAQANRSNTMAKADEHHVPAKQGVSSDYSESDLEHGNAPAVPEPMTSASASPGNGFGDVVDKLWHFCSVDRGSQYLYIGFNALYTVPGVASEAQGARSKPIGLRIWTSLLLCNDGTVVSVFERPPSPTPREYIRAMRSNVMNIFRQLSKHGASATDSIMHVSIRMTDDTANDANTAASMLFYYLFDDWTTTYSLVTHRNNPYRAQLEVLRSEMFVTADVRFIKQLDLLGRQLTILKLMYQSYELIIRRLLTQSEKTLLETALTERGIHGLRGGHSDSTTEVHDVALLDHGEHRFTRHFGVRLPMSAVVRFERLLDRIRLQALAEIEECLRQKESLVVVNFNLVALRESQSVEKLTRTTILLAKATILFLPVSLMTGYFSIQVSDVVGRYDLKTYWLCFLVVSVLSVLGLVFFGGLTSQVAGRMTYKSLTRTFWERLRKSEVKRP